MSDYTLIAEATRRIFQEVGDARALLANPTGRDELWRNLEASGLPLAWVEESLGGSGASMSEGFDIVQIAGRYAVNVPLTETLLAGWVLARAGLETPAGVLTLAPVDTRDRIALDDGGLLSGSARNVPFARGADHVVVAASTSQGVRVARVERSECVVRTAENLAGDARDFVAVKDARPHSVAASPSSFDDVLLMGAIVRSVQIAGALQSILDLSVAYANERVAFEKPIGKFQSIQHSLARLAAEAAAALAAAGSAADAIASTEAFDDAIFLEAVSAKIRVGEAAAVVCAIAHQVHGAIGFSKEHVLHAFTQRVLAWRNDFGDESFWALWLGREVARKGVDNLWPLLAAR